MSGLGWTGGVQEYVAGLSRGLHELGHEVVILSGGRPPPEGPAPHALAEGLEIVWHPKRRVARRYLYPTGLWSSLHRRSAWADVVHVHQPFFAGTWLAATTRAPLAATFYLHPEHIDGPAGRRHRQLLALLLRRLDLVVGVSAAELDLVSSVRPPRRRAIVWPGLLERPRPAPRPGGRPLVLSVGRLAPAKGIDTTLRAMAMLDGVEVAVVGDGPCAEECRALCAEVGMDVEEVMRGGSLSDDEVDRLMDRAAVLVSASRQESFGIVALKALARGARAVLSDIPSHREIISGLGADPSLLFDPDLTPHQLSQRIEAALALPPPSPQIAARAPTWIESAARAAEGYEMIVASRRRRDATRAYRSPDSSSTSR